MRRQDGLYTQRRTVLAAIIGGGLGLLLLAVGWAALRSPAAVPTAVATPTTENEPMITGNSPPSADSTTPDGSVKARTVFTRVRSLAPR